MKDMYDQVEKGNSAAYVDNKHMHDTSVKDMSKDIYTRKNIDAFGKQKAKKRVRHPLFHGINQSDIKRGIIFSEVLGKPKGLQRW